MAMDFLYQDELEGLLLVDMSSDSDSDDDQPDLDDLEDEDIIEDDEPLVQPPGNRPNIEDSLTWEKYGETDKRCKPFDFIGTPQINVPINDHNDPYEMFKLFVTDELVNQIVEQTNSYAQEFLSFRPLRQFSRFHAWKPTDCDEIFILLAIYILLGLIWKPEVEKYFTKKTLFSTPGFVNLMSHNRIKLLNRFLHFNSDPCPRNSSKKLHKIKPIFEYLVKRFSEVYTPKQDLSIDESLLLWKGRLSFKQFIRIKRARFGIKTYILSEAKSGYIWKMVVYVGKETNILENRNYGHATNVILSLVEDLLDKGYCIYADNFYCSPQAATALSERNTDIVGTVRKNRKGLPKNVVATKLKKNEVIAAVEKNEKMMYIKWADKRDVHLLSTKHELDFSEVSRRGKTTLVPSIVDNYNIFMGGVDKVDQMLSAYPLERKRQKVWYKKEFKHLINMCIFNAYALHKMKGGKMTNLQFREALVEKIILEHHDENTKPKKGRPSAEEDPLRLKQRHFPEYVPATEKKAGPTRRCVVCSKHNVRRESRYQCGDCGVALCAAPCFKVFHTTKDY